MTGQARIAASGADRLTQGDHEHLAAFRRCLRRFHGFSTGAAHEAGLATNQHQALLAIKGHVGAMTVGASTKQLFVAPHTAAELVSRLGEAGLVDKIEDASDPRRVELWLTGQGQSDVGHAVDTASPRGQAARITPDGDVERLRHPAPGRDARRRIVDAGPARAATHNSRSTDAIDYAYTIDVVLGVE